MSIVKKSNRLFKFIMDERYTETGGVFNKTDISEINQSLNEM